MSTSFLYAAAILLLLLFILFLVYQGTKEYLTSKPNQKKIDVVFKRDFKPLTKIIAKEIKYYNKTGENSKKWVSGMRRVAANQKKYGLTDAQLRKYIPKKYRGKLPWQKVKKITQAPTIDTKRYASIGAFDFDETKKYKALQANYDLYIQYIDKISPRDSRTYKTVLPKFDNTITYTAEGPQKQVAQVGA
jgi:hypothetical protein